MYNESGFSVKNFVLKIILVVLFVFLLMWLFPMPNLKPVFDRIYAENLATMKEAAKSYYTVERLPKEVNQTVRMTLNEMLAMKLVLPIADSNDELCDGEASYVEIMKTDTEYVVKTNLTCKAKSDYIVEHMGCYNLCSDQCEKKEEVKPQTNPIKPVSYTTQYELKRTWYKGYTTNTSAATTQYKHVKYETQSIFDGYTYTCPSGYGDRDGTTCYKYVRDNDYYCDEGTLVGTQCKITDTTYTYSCPSGYTKSGTGSNTTCTGVVSTTGHYECDEGTLSGSQCKIPSTTTTYSCPSGYTKSGTGSSTTCSKVTSTTSESYVGTGQAKYMPANQYPYRYVSTGTKYITDCSTTCAPYLVYTYKIYKTTTTSKTVYATPTPSSSTTYTYKPAEWVVVHNTVSANPIVSSSTTTSYVPADKSTSTMTYTKPAIRTAQYDYVTVIVDSKWTYNATEPGYTMVDKKTISGNTSTVYTPDWVLTLPAGYKQTDSKVEYKWSYYKTVTGWTFTGKTRQVKK